MGPKSKGVADSDDSTTLKQILEQLKILNSRLTKIEDKVDKIEQSLEYHSQVVEELQSDISNIKSTLPQIEHKASESENLLLNRSVELVGIPHHADESVYDIVLKVAEKLESSVTHDNIDIAYRNKSKKSIIVRFVQTHVRNDFFKRSKSRKDNSLTAKDIGFKKSDRIYVNGVLNFEARKLFYKTRLFKTKHDYKYVWTANQNVFLKKSDSTKALLIKSEHDLSELE